MSLYVSTTYFRDGSQIEDALSDLAKLNIKKIELGSNHAPIKSSTFKLPKGPNYIVHNYFPPQEKDFILNIASQNSLVREKSIKFIKNSILWCQKNKIKYYTIHPGFFAEAVFPLGRDDKKRNFDLKFDQSSIKNKSRPKVIEEAINVIKNLYDFANNKLQILIENQGSKTSHEFTLFDSFLELNALKKSVGRNLKFNFNLAHAKLSGINIDNKGIFQFFYDNSLFFEVSEISGIYDSHLPVTPKKGTIGSLLSDKKKKFKRKNLILEYRNVSFEALKASYDGVSKYLSSEIS